MLETALQRLQLSVQLSQPSLQLSCSLLAAFAAFLQLSQQLLQLLTNPPLGVEVQPTNAKESQVNITSHDQA
jgi:hypothetical protein